MQPNLFIAIMTIWLPAEVYNSLCSFGQLKQTFTLKLRGRRRALGTFFKIFRQYFRFVLEDYLGLKTF